MNISMGLTEAGIIWSPAIAPVPSSSLTAPMRSSAAVKPTPMPRPSTAEAATEFLQANASALPRMMQLTTISGR